MSFQGSKTSSTGFCAVEAEKSTVTVPLLTSLLPAGNPNLEVAKHSPQQAHPSRYCFFLQTIVSFRGLFEIEDHYN